ncbi:hypothetical protein LJC69_03780 [Bacteroidales bacterium OttesenSCG-928-K22]|nr:hypothetical protein [Bacteroidales bacterium OttesenSCG-928-L14]MDL2240727.1 hypothetical protein [Bacteroidales bacterium OttesenSCG-928-K22]
MKKNFSLLFLILVFVFSCNKNENKFLAQEIQESFEQVKYENVAIPFNTNTKSYYGSYEWTVRVGHSATNCSGCIYIEGMLRHVDCTGEGSACSVEAKVYISSSQAKSNFYTAITENEYELTVEDIFLMPNRSLYVGMDGNKEIWLNVPEQLVTRDQISEQFEFEGLFFTDEPVFENE